MRCVATDKGRARRWLAGAVVGVVVSTDGMTVLARMRSSVEREGAGMGTVANGAVAARARAQQRVAVLHADRAARDARIEDAAAAVFAELDGKVRAGERRALAVQAAQRAITDAHRVEAETVAAADQRIAGCVAALKAEGLTVAQIADLLTRPAADVRRALRAVTAPGPSPADGAASGGAAAGDGGRVGE